MMKPSPNSNSTGSSNPIPARKRPKLLIGYSYVMSSPISELKTRYAPSGKDEIIMQKITDSKAL
jgi:hypothetical protein